MRPLRALALMPLLAAAPAFADIYTWVDKEGTTHVSNLEPPEGARVLRVTRTAPRDPEREAAAREAARMAEVRALDERLRQVSMELELARQAPPPVVVVAPPPPSYTQPAPYIVNVVNQAPAGPGCDSGWGDCGIGWWPGYFPVVYPGYPVGTWFGRGGKNPRRGSAPFGYTNGQIVPPLIPLPPGHGRKG